MILFQYQINSHENFQTAFRARVLRERKTSILAILATPRHVLGKTFVDRVLQCSWVQFVPFQEAPVIAFAEGHPQQLHELAEKLLP